MRPTAAQGSASAMVTSGLVIVQGGTVLENWESLTRGMKLKEVTYFDLLLRVLGPRVPLACTPVGVCTVLERECNRNVCGFREEVIEVRTAHTCYLSVVGR